MPQFVLRKRAIDSSALAHHVQTATLNLGIDDIAVVCTVVQCDQRDLMAASCQPRGQPRHHAFRTSAAQRMNDAGDFQGSITVRLGVELVDRMEPTTNRRNDG